MPARGQARCAGGLLLRSADPRAPRATSWSPGPEAPEPEGQASQGHARAALTKQARSQAVYADQTWQRPAVPAPADPTLPVAAKCRARCRFGRKRSHEREACLAPHLPCRPQASATARPGRGTSAGRMPIGHDRARMTKQSEQRSAWRTAFGAAKKTGGQGQGQGAGGGRLGPRRTWRPNLPVWDWARTSPSPLRRLIRNGFKSGPRAWSGITCAGPRDFFSVRNRRAQTTCTLVSLSPVAPNFVHQPAPSRPLTHSAFGRALTLRPRPPRPAGHGAMSSFDGKPTWIPPALSSIHMLGIILCTSFATLRIPPSLRLMRALPLMRLLVAGILVSS